MINRTNKNRKDAKALKSTMKNQIKNVFFKKEKANMNSSLQFTKIKNCKYLINIIDWKSQATHYASIKKKAQRLKRKLWGKHNEGSKIIIVLEITSYKTKWIQLKTHLHIVEKIWYMKRYKINLETITGRNFMLVVIF